MKRSTWILGGGLVLAICVLGVGGIITNDLKQESNLPAKGYGAGSGTRAV
jgi:hypothetical protein